MQKSFKVFLNSKINKFIQVGSSIEYVIKLNLLSQKENLVKKLFLFMEKLNY